MDRTRAMQRHGKDQFDVMVVGSGFGGSVTAARLAEGGLRVLVLERGPWWGAAEHAGDNEGRRDYPHGRQATRLIRNVRWARGRRGREATLKRDGLWELHLFERLLSLTGSGVGGGSLIYTGIQSQPEDEFFGNFPDEITGEEMAPYFARVREILRPSKIPSTYPKNVVFERAAALGGLPPVEYADMAVAWGETPESRDPIINAAGIEQQPSDLVDSTFLGSPARSKTTLDLTYLPMALRASAEVRALSEVTSIARRGGGYEVEWTDHETGHCWTAAAPRLVLAAGTLNTLKLLFEARSSGAMPDLPSSLGARFSANGDMATVLYRSRALASEGLGPAATPLVKFRQDDAHQFLVAQIGLEQMRDLPLPGPILRAVQESVLMFGIGRDLPGASIWHDGRGLRTNYGRETSPVMFGAMEDAMDRLSKGYEPRRVLTNFPGGRGKSPILTVHPIGGASIGRSPEHGVVDHTGQVFGHPGLYVADGALYPAAPGVPPSMTIAALAERQAQLLLDGITAAATPAKRTKKAAAPVIEPAASAS